MIMAMTFTLSEATVVIGLLLISPLLCVFASLSATHLERKALTKRETTLDAREWELEVQKVAMEDRELAMHNALEILEARKAALKQQAASVATLANSEIDYMQDQTTIRIADWELEDPKEAVE